LKPAALLSASCPSPRSFTTTLPPHPHAHAGAPLLGFLPLQRSTKPGVRIPRRFHPPAPSVFRVSHPLDVLLRLIPYRAYCIPAALWGFTRTSTARPDLSIQTGPARPSPLFTAFSSRTTDTFWRALPSCASRPSCAEPFHGLDVDRCGRCTVLIAQEAVYPLVASQRHQPS
jgi:hypothetical protein